MAFKNISDRDRFMRKVNANGANGCWVWMGALFGNRYGAFRMNGKQMKAHRVSWIMFRGGIPGGLKVCHTCDNPKCVNPEHLWLGTDRDNMIDCIAKGRHVHQTHPELLARGEKISIPLRLSVARGESHSRAKLKTAEVLEIRRLYSLGVRAYILAKMFRSARNTIAHIVHLERRVSG